ncbi:MAG: GNAT family N-acetyltransferase [Proteiniphilum sp.]|jgi:predicted acetyltransferase|nr:GNAT family N-acetyltransferase [Proteiniphilum sp.]
MIRFADETTRPQVWEMWKTVFGDPDAYMELYFRHKYRDENTLLYMEDGKVAASLQMLPYLFTFCGTEIPAFYLSGVATLPIYRKRGYVRQLLMRSFEEAARRDVPLILLVPQKEWLLNFYGRFGFAQAFDAGTVELPSLRELTGKYPGDLHAAFREFNALFRQKDMTVQKSFNDFRAIVEEATLYDFPPAKNLTGMARVIDAGKLLSLFTGRYNRKSFSMNVRDELLKSNNALFTGGQDASAVAPALTVDIRELAQLLLGYHTSEKAEPLSALFPEKEPQMHFMLE